MPLEFVPALCTIDLDARSNDDALLAIATQALAAGYVRSTFADALLAREHAYPTGLPTPVPIAIPHADPEHVVKQGLGFGLLRQPVPFQDMGDPEQTVDVSALALLLVPSDELRVETLQAVVTIFQRPDWWDSARAAPDSTALANTLNELLAAARA